MSLTTFDLPMIFTCGIELAQATANFRPEDFPKILAELGGDFSDDEDESETAAAVDATLRWHAGLDGILKTSNRLKRALGATGPLDAGDQLHDKTTPEWKELKNHFKYAAHSAKAQKALCHLSYAAVDLSGYASDRDPEAAQRQHGLNLLRQGLACRLLCKKSCCSSEGLSFPASASSDARTSQFPFCKQGCYSDGSLPFS
jgi:hypothetical protein